MTPQRFKQLGIMLYGQAWQFRMADELSVASKTVWRWQKGERAIPDGLEAEILSKLIPAQVEALRAMRAL